MTLPALSASSVVVLAFVVLCLSVVLNVVAFRALRRSSMLLDEQSTALQQVRLELAELQSMNKQSSSRIVDEARMLSKVAQEVEAVKARVAHLTESGPASGKGMEVFTAELRRLLQSKDVQELLDGNPRR